MSKAMKMYVTRIAKQLQKFEDDDQGKLETGDIITLVIGLIVLAIMLPVAISELIGVNTTAWPTAVAAVWDLMPILAVLAGLVMLSVGYVSKKR